MKEVIIISLFALFLASCLIASVNIDTCGKFPVYGRNGNKFRNFSIGDFVIFTFFIPAFILWKPFTKLSNFFKKRPFVTFKYQVGDKVTYHGKTYTVTEAFLDSEGVEVIRLDMNSFINVYRADNKDIKKLTPLEEALK